MRSPTAKLVAALACGVVGLFALASGAGAQSIEDKRAQAEAILAEVQQLDEEVGAAAERWNGANLELQSLETDLRETREGLVRAKQLYRVSQARVAQRLRDLYLQGEPDSTLDVLLGARSLDEVIAGIDATQRIAAQDARITTDARGLRARVAAREKQLSDETKKQVEIVDGLEAEKAAIESRLAERERLLASVQDEVARLEEAERRRQAELQRQAAAELERQRRAAAEASAAVEQAPETASASDTASSPDTTADSEPAAPRYAPPPADASRGAQVVAIALRYLGIPYKWGAASPSIGFDCSGLTMYVFAQIGVSLPHFAAAQFGMGSAVSRDQLEPGDLVFFRGLGHMGMYIGGGNFIHAPRTGDVVKISSLSESYYVSNWVGARRVL